MLNKRIIATWLIAAAALLPVSALFIARELVVAGTLGFPLDDAWIHLAFADNFAQGLGFCFNPGEPVAGSTGPLWTAMLGAHIALFGTAPLPVKLLGLSLLLCSAMLASRVARQLGAGPVTAAAAAALVAVTPRLQWAALSGMELAPAILLSLAGFTCYLSWREGGRSIFCLAAGALFGLAGWARPEALVLAGGPGVDLLWHAWKGRRGGAARTVLPLVLLVAGFAVPAGGLFLFNYRLGGGVSVLPSTFTAKTIGLSLFDRLAGGASAVDVFRPALQTFWPVVKYILLPDNLLLALLLPFLFVGGRGGEASRARPLWAALVLLPFLRALVTGEPANFQQYGRYLAVLSPLFIILGVLAVQRAFPARGQQGGGGPEAPDTPFGPLLITVFGAAGALGLFYLLKRGIFGMGHQWPQAGSQWYLPFLGQAQPCHVAAFLLIGLAAVPLVRLVRVRVGRRTSTMALLVLWLASSVSLVENWQAATEYAWNVRNIEMTQVRIGRWLAEETPPDAVVATNDIGAIGFFGDRRVIDMVGLVTPEVLDRLRRTRDREAALLGYFREDRPDYLVMFDDWYPGIASRTDLHEELLRVPIENNLTCGSPATREMTVYRWTARRWGPPPGP